MKCWNNLRRILKQVLKLFIEQPGILLKQMRMNRIPVKFNGNKSSTSEIKLSLVELNRSKIIK
jgi:hypothetical protein